MSLLKSELDSFPVKDVLNLIFSYIRLELLPHTELLRIVERAKRQLPPAYEAEVSYITPSQGVVSRLIEWHCVWDLALYKYCLFYSENETKFVFAMQNGSYVVAVAETRSLSRINYMDDAFITACVGDTWKRNYRPGWLGMNLYVGEDLDVLLCGANIQDTYYLKKLEKLPIPQTGHS